MGFKIRNKGFGAPWMGTTNVRCFPAKKTQVNVDLSQHVTLQVQITRFTGMRILHNYRNISRATKQFMLGDRFFEQLMILTLREHFFRPMYYRAPIENTFFMVSCSALSLTPFAVLGTHSCRLDRSSLRPVRQQPAPASACSLSGIQPLLAELARCADGRA